MSNIVLKKEKSFVGRLKVTPEMFATTASVAYNMDDMECFTISKNVPIRSFAGSAFVAAGTTFTENIEEQYEISSWMVHDDERYGVLLEKNSMEQIVANEEKGARPTNRIFPSVQLPHLRNGIRNTYFSRGEDMLKAGLFPIINRLMKFADLKPGWNDKGSKPVTFDVIFKAFEFYSELLFKLNKKKKVAPLPFIAPVDDSSILFEWKTTYKEFIVSIPANKQEKINYLKVENTVFGENEKEGFVDSLDDIINMVIDWLLEIHVHI